MATVGQGGNGSTFSFGTAQTGVTSMEHSEVADAILLPVLADTIHLYVAGLVKRTINIEVVGRSALTVGASAAAVCTFFGCTATTSRTYVCLKNEPNVVNNTVVSSSLSFEQSADDASAVETTADAGEVTDTATTESLSSTGATFNFGAAALDGVSGIKPSNTASALPTTALANKAQTAIAGKPDLGFSVDFTGIPDLEVGDSGIASLTISGGANLPSGITHVCLSKVTKTNVNAPISTTCTFKPTPEPVV